MTIDILCKVVDNFGDIGVVYRLAKALGDCDKALQLRLIVDDLFAFQKLAPAVNPALAYQQLFTWQLFRWDTPWDTSVHEKPSLVLECFSCGRPAWFEALLFDTEDARIRWIIDIEHLSAEEFAEDFHLMPSLTRSSRVKKMMFMPGFTEKTGGLIIDRAFKQLCDSYARSDKDDADSYRGHAALAKLRLDWARRVALESAVPYGAEEHLWIPIFTYVRSFERIVADLAVFNQDKKLLVFAAAGPSQDCLISAWKKAGRPFPLIELAFLRQELWDELLLASDFSIVRGEESLSRAALAGKPFLWHAYALEGEHQLVKVQALLTHLQRFIPEDLFEEYAQLSIAFNDRTIDGGNLPRSVNILPFLKNEARLHQSFKNLAQVLLNRPDMACRLLTFIRNLV